MAKSPDAPPGGKRVDRSLLFLVGLALTSAALCLLLNGLDAFRDAARHQVGMLAQVLPVMAGAVLLGGILQALVPPPMVRRWLGEGSGLRGLLLAVLCGTMVPGGPVMSFPLVLTLTTAGADLGVTVAFLTSWSVLGLNRVIVWELPFMGGKFALMRYLVSVPLPIIAGLLVRRLPVAMRRPAPGED